MNNFNLFTAVNDFKFIDEREKIVLQILMQYNCRIGEVLNAVWNNFVENNFLILKGEKHSYDVVIRDRELIKRINNLNRNGQEKIFYNINYYRIYKIIKVNYSHLFVKYKGKKNFKVTHVFRYVAANLAIQTGDAQAVLYHKTNKTQNYYLTQENKKNIKRK